MTLEKIKLTNFFRTDLISKWEKRYSIFSNTDVRDWISHKVEKYTRNGKDPMKFKITNYLKYLDDYCGYYKIKNPSELLEENIDDKNSRLLRYLSHLIKEGHSEVTVKNGIQSIIKSFYSDRGSPCSDGLGIRKSGDNQNEIILDKSIIRKIQSRLERPEYRLIVKLLAETGLRVDDVLVELKSGKYNLQKYKDHFFIRNFRTLKAEIIINYVFFPKESTDLMKAIYGNDLENLELTTILLTKRGTDIRKNDVWNRIKNIAKELNIKENMKLHCFRKFFNTAVILHKDLDSDFKEHLMGHSINLSQSYNNNLRDIEWFYNTWRKIEPLISIDSIIVDNTISELTDVKKENMNLKQQIEILLESKINLEKKLKDLSKSTPSKEDIERMILDIMKTEKVKIDF